MELQFTKMHGLGNDFVVFNGVRQAIALTPEKIHHIADRRLGVGCDQVLVVSPATQPGADFHYQIFNADGSQAEQCGNGARCVARFITEQGLSEKPQLTLQTLRGLITTELLSQPHVEPWRVKVSLGQPRFEPVQLPFNHPKQLSRYAMTIADQDILFGTVNLGNPHAVLQVDDVTVAPLATVGKALECHASFPQRTNVEFMEVISRQQIRLRVWERGVGETPACGTGACAAVVIGREWGLLDPTVDVVLPGGLLTVEYQDAEHPVFLIGPADTVFRGKVKI